MSNSWRHIKRNKKPRKTKLPSDWRDRLVINKSMRGSVDYEYIVYKLEFKLRKTPKGFARFVGELSFCKSKGTYFVEESVVDPYFRGRKLGSMLYEFAIKDLQSISTYYHSASNDAKRVWLSLCRKYPHESDFFSDKLTVKLI